MNTTIAARIRRIAPALALLACAATLTGCLTAERKAMRFTVNPDGTGSGRIVFRNIMSLQEDDVDRSLADYTKLVESYLQGYLFEQNNPALYNVKKRLYAENNQLHAEVAFDFSSYQDVGLYRHNGVGPWMFFSNSTESSIEQYDTSNGQYGGEIMPVIFWPEETKEFLIMNYFNNGDRPAISLHQLYKRIGVTEKKKEEDSK